MTDPAVDPAVDPDDLDFDNESALAELLNAGLLFIGEAEETVAVYVNCSDVFAWACADIEPVPLRELPALYRAWKADSRHGPSKWCCLHRRERPQGPVERRMKAAGVWDAAMEALPPNQADIRLREYHERKAQEQAAQS